MRRALLFMMMLTGATLADSPVAATPSQASDLVSKTVALVDAEGNAFCTGVWVSKTTIVTALHCVDGESLVLYATKGDITDDDVTPRASLTYTVDRANDLALLRAVDAPKHGIAHTRKGDIEQGLPVQNMGMPTGLYFSYATGEVSAIRWWGVQTTTPVSPGCSGSGLFDMHGDLVGIGHTMSKRATLVGFFVHKNYVDALLRAQGKNL
jgi:S1-C subfamily serine protease